MSKELPSVFFKYLCFNQTYILKHRFLFRKKENTICLHFANSIMFVERQILFLHVNVNSSYVCSFGNCMD